MKNTKLKKIVYISLLVSTLCVICPFSINIGPIPFSLATLFIMLYATLFDLTISVSTVIIYILLGCVGLPVFSGGVGGIQKIFSPTGGFIIGYIFLCLIIALFYNKSKNVFYKIFILICANFILYSIGVMYFIIITNNTFLVALSLCVFPFLLTDAIKIILVINISKWIKSRLSPK